ncbi:MAG TPA: DUF429 domain-containing protein [Micromonosporaceae bacterium]|jgi:hypothetical protein
MLTLGIDLAASPARTAACTIDWTASGVRGEVRPPPLDDADLLRLMRDADRIGIDCPLGWPVAFVEAVASYQAGDAWPGRDAADPGAYRRALVYRRTDELVVAGGSRPLSVSTDRIGVVALRCAALLDAFAPPSPGVSPDRSGTSAVAEVYPAAAMRRWGLTAAGYKATRVRAEAALDRLVADLRAAAPWLDLPDATWAHCRRTDHAFDAVIASLVTRAVARGLTIRPGTDEDRSLAAVEGWIHVPTGDIADLR